MDQKINPAGTRSTDRLLDARRDALSVRGPHRLEPVATIDGVLYLNDSKATFLDAAIESFASFEDRAVWIAGAWSDDMGEGHMMELLRERVAAVVLFGIQPKGEPIPDRVFHADDVRMAVFLARELAKQGEIVLFSPACPSGNGFANYEERGAEFKRAVRDL